MGRKPTRAVAERPKTRKELRKDKRTQKKANRVHFHVRKKELKIEYRERLKQQKKDKSQPKKKGAAAAALDEDDAAEDDDDVYDQADMTDGDDDDNEQRGEYEYGGADEEGDEEIESDFELSDEELEQKFAGRVKPKAKAHKPEPDRFQQDLQKEKQKQRQLEKQMKKQRVKQLIAANEDEDKVIRRLEKQLKIDKKRSEKHVPKMFNDGLEYALELCLPENIQKMYTAAKEAADNEGDSDAGFQEDLDVAMGKTTDKAGKKRGREGADGDDGKAKQKKGAKDVVSEKAAVRASLKMAKLREMESKYFDTDDELDSDLSGNDSEYERDDEGSDNDAPLEVHKNNKTKKRKPAANEDVDEDSEEGDDFGLMDDEDDFDDDESESDGDDDDEEGDYSDEESDEAPVEVLKKSRKDTPIKKEVKSNGKVERTLADLSEDDELDSDDFDDFGESEDEVPAKKKAKKDTPIKQAPNKGKKVERTLADLSEDDELDDDDFGDSEDEGSAGNKAKADVWEDIYGRSRDKDGNVIKVN